ncbi:MAG: hypothetical protein ACTSXJ_08925, partial [Candidatus Baldrarchaeia archaeon]
PSLSPSLPHPGRSPLNTTEVLYKGFEVAKVHEGSKCNTIRFCLSTMKHISDGGYYYRKEVDPNCYLVVDRG